MFVAFCLAALFSANPASDVEVLQFTSSNCPACRALEPVISRAASDGVRVRHLDFEANEALAARFKIDRLPTLVLVRNGQEIDRAIGSMSYDQLTGWLRNATGGEGAAAATQPQPAQFNQPTPLDDQVRPLRPKMEVRTLEHVEPISPAAEPPRGNHHPESGGTLHETSASVSPEQAAFAATVRLKVEEGQGFGYGTGTVVDCHGEEALVLTCGHLFRNNQGKGKITIDMFAPGQPQGVAGHLIDFDLKRDVALVAFRPGVQLAAVPVAGVDYKSQVGERVFTIGCNKGSTPSVVGSEVASVEKYQGHPNVTVKGTPIDGRSGGGLFTADGRLVGVCNAADDKDNEGVYASLPAVHWQLDRIGQQRIYQGTRPTSSVAAGPTHLSSPGNVPSLPSEMPRGLSGSPSLAGASTPPTNAAPATPAVNDLEVLCVVRSKTQPHLQPQVFQLQQLPPEVQQQIAAANAAQNAQGASPPPRVAANPGEMIIRGQR